MPAGKPFAHDYAKRSRRERDNTMTAEEKKIAYDTLKEIRELLSSEYRWVQWYLAVDANRNQVDATSPSATSWCMLGAGMKVCGFANWVRIGEGWLTNSNLGGTNTNSVRSSARQFSLAMRSLAETLGITDDDSATFSSRIAEWNNSSQHQEILEALDQTLNRLAGELGGELLKDLERDAEPCLPALR